MSLPVPTDPVELSGFRRRARRLVDTVSDLIRHGPHTYAAFPARVNADRPAKDNGWDHFIDICLRQVLARDPPSYNAPEIQAQFAAGMVPFGVHLLNRLHRRLQDDLRQLEDAQRGRPPFGPAAGWPGYAAPDAHLFPMPAPPTLMPLPFPPFGAHHHHQLHHHHLFRHPLGFPMMQHHFPHQHVHLTALLQLPIHHHHHHHHHHPHQHVAQRHPLQQPQYAFAPPPQHAVPVPPTAQVGDPTASALGAQAASVPLSVPTPGLGVQQPEEWYGAAHHVPQSAAGGMTPVRTTGEQPTRPPLAVPLAEPAATGTPPQTTLAPEPRAELAVPQGAPPVVPGGPMPVPAGVTPAHGVQDGPPMGGIPAEVQAAPAAQEAAADCPRDISELPAQALDTYRREVTGGEGAAQAAQGNEADVGELIAQALAIVAPRTEEATEELSEEAGSGGQGTERGVTETQARAADDGAVEPSGERAKVEGVEDPMWEWRKWRQVAPVGPCPVGLVYSMDLHAGTSCARLPDNLRAWLDAVEPARGGGADERPLAPFPPRPETPPAVIAAGGGEEEVQEEESMGDEAAYGPGESALALMYEDEAGPDIYAGMDVDPANAPLLPMPTAVPPPPLGSCEQRHCRFHAAEGAHRHRLMGTGRREAGMLVGALERYEFQRPGQVAQEKTLVAESPDDGQLRCIQLGDAAVLDHHAGDVRAAEPQESLPLSVRLSVGRLLDEAGMEDVRRDSGLYVALWRGGANAWRREQAVRPLTPQARGSHALLVAMHPEGVEVVFGTDRLLLADDGAVLVPTSSSYHLESRGSDPRLLVVVGTRPDPGAGPQGPEPHAVPVGGDEAAAHERDMAGEEQPAEEEQEQGPPEVAEEVDVQAHVAAALARIMAAASPPPATEAMEEEDQRRESGGAQEAMEQEEELEIVGVKEAHEVGPQEMGVADKAGPKTGAVETCMHWAKGWCMRADACRYAHSKPPVPQ